MEKLLVNLNPEQLSAVTMPDESALILAGAGSGKTRVLTTRIAWLLQTNRVSPAGILAVTFTNKAAKEMLARLSVLCAMNTKNLWVGTFHGLCNHILRLHHRDAALPQGYIILDAQDQLSMVKRIIKAQELDETRFQPRSVVNFINGAKEKGLRAAFVQTQDNYSRTLQSLYEHYENQCQHEGVVDFAELLLRCCELLERNEPLREHYQARFKYLLVDEFQDTNDLQYRWLKLLSSPQTAVFAVGDDDQSIYAFRGANVGNMQAFLRDFHVKNIIKLEQNYRSFGNILNAANTLIANNKARLGKNLRTDAQSGPLITVNELDNDFYEAQWILDEINSLAGDGMNLNDIAILYRSNAQSRVLEHALFSAGIPYRVHGGLRFFERAEVKHAIAYLQLVDNPDNNAAFLRIVNFPARGIGSRTIERLQDTAQQNNQSLFEACDNMTGKSANSLANFKKIITSIQDKGANLTLQELVELTLESSGLVAHYQREKEGADRLDNLGQLVSACNLFLAEEGYSPNIPAMYVAATSQNADTQGMLVSPVTIVDADISMPAVMSPLSSFLSHASLEAGESQANSNEHAVQLMTVHASKGLEFPTVFISGLEEGIFPHENSMSEKNGVEEERRLMYVAITRAKSRLFISYARSRMLFGRERFGIASRFIDELPDESLRWLSKDNVRQTGGSPVPFVYSKKQNATDVAVASRKIAKDSPWHPGKRVEHAKFGKGTIRKIEGNPPQLRALIDFDDKGTKMLDLTIARLTNIS